MADKIKIGETEYDTDGRSVWLPGKPMRLIKDVQQEAAERAGKTDVAEQGKKALKAVDPAEERKKFLANQAPQADTKPIPAPRPTPTPGPSFEGKTDSELLDAYKKTDDPEVQQGFMREYQRRQEERAKEAGQKKALKGQ
jgi:Mg-chelatase subunit ChlI